MRPRSQIEAAVQMSRYGSRPAEISRALGIPRTTVRDWLAGELREGPRPNSCPHCGDDPSIDAEPYAYLLGLYLGDGCLAAHRRGVHKLRITLDKRYPTIIVEASVAMRCFCHAAVYARSDHCVEVYGYWRHWPCLLPQHGLGKKHERRIVLAEWQVELVDRAPEPLIRGLIHSDGCRATNTGRGGWSHPRYSFSNRSDDIHRILRGALDRIGVHWTAAPRTTYVSRIADVARLDGFIGPKA